MILRSLFLGSSDPITCFSITLLLLFSLLQKVSLERSRPNRDFGNQDNHCTMVDNCAADRSGSTLCSLFPVLFASLRERAITMVCPGSAYGSTEVEQGVVEPPVGSCGGDPVG